MPAGLMLGLGHFHKDTITLLCSGFMYCHCYFLRAGPPSMKGSIDPRIWDTRSGSRHARLTTGSAGKQQRARCRSSTPAFPLCSS